MTEDMSLYEHFQTRIFPSGIQNAGEGGSYKNSGKHKSFDSKEYNISMNQVHTGMKTLGSILSERDIEFYLQRMVRNFDNFAAIEQDPKQHKKFWWEQICKTYYPEEWADPKQKSLIFRKVMGQTSKFTLSELRSIFDRSFRWRKNPPALFWKLVKEKREEIKKQLSTV